MSSEFEKRKEELFKEMDELSSHVLSTKDKEVYEYLHKALQHLDDNMNMLSEYYMSSGYDKWTKFRDLYQTIKRCKELVDERLENVR